MNDFDYLPETAEELVIDADGRCTCRHDWITDDADYVDAMQFRRMQRSKFALVELNPDCRYGDHAERFRLTTKQSEDSIII